MHNARGPDVFARQTIKYTNMDIEVTRETPICQLTVGQLSDYLGKQAIPLTRSSADNSAPSARTPRYVYGLKGIMDLFHVSNVTAQRYKRGIIREAVYQQGRVIAVDADKAMQLFREKKGQEKE